MRNVIYILVALGLMSIGLFTMMGEIQKVIKFEDPINEMVFCVLFFFLGIGTLMNVNVKKV